MRYLTSSFVRWLIFLFLTLAVVVLAASSTMLIDRLKKQEIQRIEVIATAMKFMQDEHINDPETLELILAVLKDNNSIPIILTDENYEPILENLSEITISRLTSFSISKTPSLSAFSIFKISTQPIIEERGVPIWCAVSFASPAQR